jgi:hypothetical protein
MQSTIQYLGVPAHIADAYDSRRDAAALYLRGGRVKRHGKCLASVQDLDYPAIERPDLRTTISEKTNREDKSPNKGDTDVYPPVSRPGIDVPPSRRFCRTEVTAYESLEHSVPSVRHDATIQGVR